MRAGGINGARGNCSWREVKEAAPRVLTLPESAEDVVFLEQPLHLVNEFFQSALAPGHMPENDKSEGDTKGLHGSVGKGCE